MTHAVFITAVGGKFLVLFVEMGSSVLTYRTILELSRFTCDYQMRSKLSGGYLINSTYKAIQLILKKNITAA